MDAALDSATRVPRVDRLLAEATAALDAAGVGTPRLDAELLLATACRLDRAALYARSREPLSHERLATFRALLARRVRREPLQYLVGRQEFWSLDFVVTPHVLIPRPETELLVELALRLPLSPRFGKTRNGGPAVSAAVGEQRQYVSLQERPAQPALRLCDVGTGSGCIAVTLAHELPDAEVWALDVSTRALAVAELNAQRLGVARRVRFLRSDLFGSVANRRFDLIVANPPYLTNDDLADLQPEIAFEPRGALDGGTDGLDTVRRLLAAAPDHLIDGGWLLMEIGAGQATDVEMLARAAGLNTVAIRPDYAGLPRVLMAQR
jgi:release factor glutamine methyltransferase